jgi:hypothetical protein
MNRVNFGRTSGTIVDVCRGHGTFLDSGELQAILAFIEGGGLEQARTREIQQLQDERRRLERARAARSDRTRGGGPAEFRSTWNSRSLLALLRQIRKE